MIVTLLLRDGAAAGRFGGAIPLSIDATLSIVRLYTRPRARKSNDEVPQKMALVIFGGFSLEWNDWQKLSSKVFA